MQTINHDEMHLYRREKIRFICLMLFGLLLIIALFFISLCSGNFKTSLADVVSALSHPNENQMVYKIITMSRLPRLVASLLVGAALAASGWVYQELFNNRMASPDILGVSAGAGCGASTAILLGFTFFATSAIAFVSGLVTVGITIILSSTFGKRGNNSISLILSGIVMGGLLNSLMGLIKYMANDTQLSTITFWLLGGFYSVSWEQLLICAPIICCGLITLYLLRWKIVILRNGEDDAAIHGVNPKCTKMLCIVIATVITSAAVCISGTIGWIGLAIPNMIRLLVKDNGKRVLSLSIVYGALFMEMCDLLARCITNTEIPVGIISGLIGALLFIMVIITEKARGKLRHDSN